MTKISVVSFKTMEKLLIKLGFVAVRQKGSHIFYRHPDGRTTTIPKHARRVLSRPLVREILHDINISSDEYMKLLKS